MERVKGIEPSSQAWEARILPLNHTRAPTAATSSINHNVSQLLFWPGATCLGRYSTADCPTRMNPLDQKRMSCPACSRALTEKQAGSVSLIVCQNGCGGVWFDALELDRVDEESEAVGELLLHIERDPSIDVDALGARNCPRCEGIPLKRVLLSPGSHVHVHECPSCDACWLDYAEIAKLYDERVDLMNSGKIEKRSRSSDLIQYLYEVRTGRRRH